MTVRVENEWGGTSKSYRFRLTFVLKGEHHRHTISREEGDEWSRAYATEALNDLENLYDVLRRNVRFNVI